MRFKILSIFQDDQRRVIYSIDEQSFDMDTSLFSDFTLMLGCAYLGLDVSLATSQIVNISGFCPKEIWISKPLVPPDKSEKGIIEIVPDSDLVSGTGICLFSESQMYYDEKNKYCYIDFETRLNPDRNIRFCENALISLCDDVIVGIWIQLINE